MSIHIVFGVTIILMVVLSFMAVIDDRPGGRVTILVIQIAGYAIIILCAITITIAPIPLDL